MAVYGSQGHAVLVILEEPGDTLVGFMGLSDWPLENAVDSGDAIRESFHPFPVSRHNKKDLGAHGRIHESEYFNVPVTEATLGCTELCR